MDCEYCEQGACEYCDGLTIEGFDCECAEANHYDNPRVCDDIERDDEELW